MKDNKMTHRIILMTIVTLVGLYSSIATATDYTAIADRICTAAALRAHPRSLLAGAEGDALKAALLSGDKAVQFQAAKKAIVSKDTVYPHFTDEPAMPVATTPSDIFSAKGATLIPSINNQTGVAIQAALIWSITKEDMFKDIAMQRLSEFARADPSGITGLASFNMANFYVFLALSSGLDYLDSALPSGEKTAYVASLEARFKDLEQYMLRDPRTSIIRYPRDSIGFMIFGTMARATVINAGQVPSATRLCKEVVGDYLSLISPWGGTDGGHAEGTAYGMWDSSLVISNLTTIKYATDIDVFASVPFLQNYGRYLIYFMPPGTQTALFGDGAEENFQEYIPRLGKQYVRALAPQPLYEWYDHQLSGEDISRLDILMMPPRGAGAGTFPSGTPHAAVFQSIGWAAMHSDLTDLNRTSVYFRSSPFGTRGHMHADNNGFVISVKGKKLIPETGYYDYYGSPHHAGWTKKSVANNVITYDGGAGQILSSTTATGEITQFSTTTDVDLVSGEAKVAYGGDISGARRSIAYLRPGIVVVFDKMKSTAPHKWEWNFHSLDKLAIDTATNKAEVSNGGVRACLKFVGNAPVTGEAYTGFPVNPVRDASNPRPDQAHGRFVVKTASTTFVSAVVIDVGCTLTGTPDITVTDAGATVKVAGQTVTFDGAAVSAAPTPAPVASGPVVVGSTPAPTPAAPAIDTSASTVVEATDKTAAEVVGTGTTDTGATTGSTSTTTGSTGSETTSTTTTPKATRGHATWGSTSGASASSSATSSGKGRVTGSGSSGGSSGGGGGSASASSGGGGGGSGAARVSGGSSASASGSGVIMATPRGTILRAPTKAPTGLRVIGSHIVKSTAPKAEAVKEETKAAKENDPLVDENAGTDIQNPENLNAEDEEVKDDPVVDDVDKEAAQ